MSKSISHTIMSIYRRGYSFVELFVSFDGQPDGAAMSGTGYPVNTKMGMQDIVRRSVRAHAPKGRLP